MTTPIYIHYGSDAFEPLFLRPIRNSNWQTKPEGGLWASREDDNYGWKQWSEENHFHLERLHHSFRFRLSPSARVLTLNTPEDLLILPKLHPWRPKDYTELFSFEDEHKGEVPSIDQLNRWFAPNLCYLDFEKLAEEYDAVELTHCGAFNDCLGMWDCNSIVVMNSDVVEVV